MHNSDIGRWFAPDPYGQFYSPYVSMGNNPISGVDPDGGYYIGNDASRWRGYGQTEPNKGPGYVGGSWEKYVYESNLNDANYLSAYKKWQKHWGDGWVNGNLNSTDAQAALEVIKRQYGKLENANYGALSALNHNMLMRSGGASTGASHGGVSFLSGNARDDYQASHAGSMSGFFASLNDAGLSTQDYLSGDGDVILINGQYAAGTYSESFSGAYNVPHSEGAFGAANDWVTSFNGHTIDVVKGDMYAGAMGARQFGNTYFATRPMTPEEKEGMVQGGIAPLPNFSKFNPNDLLNLAKTLRNLARKGQAPRGIKRVDIPKMSNGKPLHGQKPHVHFDDKRALNLDGTWKHGDGDIPSFFTNWLNDLGF